MFTGLVEEVGTLKEVRSVAQGYRLKIGAGKVLEDVKYGDSIATNGVCLTVADYGPGWFEADMMEVTAEVTGIHQLSTGSPLNLERALRPMDRMGGHILQGHVDVMGRISSRRDAYPFTAFSIGFPREFQPFVVKKGSIGINGISLTISELISDGVEVSIIPETIANTNLAVLQPGDRVCLEFDVLGKYVARQLSLNGENREEETGLSRETLRQFGF